MFPQKKFHVYGVGNALVDIDFEINPSLLEKLKIEKGVMTLITVDRQLELLEELSGVKHVKACGGSVANTIMAVTQLGGKTFYSCKVANDTFGVFFYEELINNGVMTNLSREKLPHGTTGTCLVLVTADASRTMNTHLGITETLSSLDLHKESIAEAQYLYIEGYLATSPTGSEAAIRAYEIARANHTKIALSLSDPNIVKYYHARLLEMMGGGVDLLFCNETEAKWLCQSEDLQIVCQKLKAIAETFAITQGPRGSLVYDGTHLYDIAAHDVPVVDTVGAGDMYAGGFLHSITHGYDYETAGIIADMVASKVVSKFGPRLDHQEANEVVAEIDEFLSIKNHSMFSRRLELFA